MLKLSKFLAFALLSGSFCLLFHHNLSYAEETQLSEIKQAGISWGRKYFFDAPRFKDNDVQELIDRAIIEKLISFGIQITEGSNKKYVLNYTLVLEDYATQLEIEDLYEQEPELKDSSNEASNFEHGKFIISIRDYDTRAAVWKNNVEGIAGLDMADDVRQKRVKAIVDEVFSTFPD